jgi:type I restriction enzyme S subunit
VKWKAVMSNIPKGYKQTEVGVIPEDWEVKKLGKIGEFCKGKGIKKDEVLSDGLPCIRYGEIYTTYTDYIKTFVSFISRAVANQSQRIQKGDLLFAGSGETAEEIGKCVAFVDDEEAYAGGDIVILTPKGVDSLFLGYLMNDTIMVCQKSRVGQGDAVVHISAKNLGELLIPLPPTKAEQTAIAAALSDADALISGLEKLIAKKRNIKQGAMQKLLTGKKRLQGFSGEWEVKKLGEVCSKITTGKLDANAMKENGEYRFYTCAKSFYFIDKYAFDDEALLISGNGENVGYVHYYRGKFNAYQRTYVLTGFNSNIHYLNLYLDRFLEARITAEVNAGNTPYIKMGTLTDMEIAVPIDIEEQTAIAQIISDMDAEIEELEQKLDKYKMIKQGMMQELLTGKTRLI